MTEQVRHFGAEIGSLHEGILGSVEYHGRALLAMGHPVEFVSGDGFAKRPPLAKQATSVGMRLGGELI
jgi:hypothetical protein